MILQTEDRFQILFFQKTAIFFSPESRYFSLFLKYRKLDG